MSTVRGGMNTSGFDPERLVRDYGDPDEEARACRTTTALFDFSFLGVADVSGYSALDAVATLLGRHLAGMGPGEIRYSLRASSDDVLVSDLTVWKMADRRYRVMSGRREDIHELIATATPGVRFDDLTDELSVLAVQGPFSLEALAKFTDSERLAAVPYFGHASAKVAGVDCHVGRLGYTGERGFEILAPASARDSLWAALGEFARPAGFAAADALRIEAGFVLFANEFRLPVTAAEVGLRRFAAPSDVPPRIRLVCFRADEGPVARPFRPPEPPDLPECEGTIAITSAAYSTIAGGILGLGFVYPANATVDRPLSDVSGTFRGVRVAPLPFYDPGKQRPRGPW